MADYITIANSNATLSKKFKVILSGFKEPIKKAGKVSTTIDGALDVSLGSLRREWSYAIRVYHAPVDTSFGSKAELETFFSYNDPGGTPTNILTMTDHYGQTRSVVMLGDFDPQLLGVVISGSAASSIVMCHFIAKDKE